MLRFTYNDDSTVELIMNGKDKELAESQADKVYSAEDIALGVIALEALKGMGFEAKKELCKHISLSYTKYNLSNLKKIKKN